MTTAGRPSCWVVCCSRSTRYIADPEGNRWEIAWAGTARFDERGALLSFG
ncbi:hypothetical protein [Micromonospora sp. NPDC005205]